MTETLCFLEVYDEETDRWNYVSACPFPEPVNCWYNNLDPFFNSHNLYFLFRTLENEGQTSLFPKFKGLPLDCSETIEKAYYFHTEEVNMFYAASFTPLSALFTFDYSTTIDLREVPPVELELLYPQIDIVKKEIITLRQWLGYGFFTELEEIRHFLDKYPTCRLVYFLYKLDLS